MKIYTVILESYYDDFSEGGVYELASPIFTSKDEAETYFEGMKEIVREMEAKHLERLARYGFTLEDKLTETDGYYCIGNRGAYWGSCVRIEESETQDGVPFRKEDWCDL